MNASLRQLVVARAESRCEYCLVPEEAFPGITFHIEHIRARKHGGATKEWNLCLSCDRCNNFKGTDFSGFDPETDAVTILFNPREESWDEHFRVDGGMIAGRTATGRTTVALLKMNETNQLEFREQLMFEGLWPNR